MRTSAVPILVLFSLLCLVVAALLYPGSSYYHHAAHHYLIWENTLSDTGATQNYRGEALHWSPLFFSLGIFAGAGALVLFFRQFVYPARNVLLTLMGLAFSAIPFMPSDLTQPYHNYVFFGAVVLLTVNCIFAASRSKNSWLRLTSVLLVLYIIFMVTHQDTTATYTIHTLHVVFQKVSLLWVFGTLTICTWLANRHPRHGVLQP